MKNLLNKNQGDIEDISLTGIKPHERDYDPYYGYKTHNTLYRNFYSYLKKFLNAHIGYSYNKTKNEFVEGALAKGYPKVLGSATLETRFENMFEEHAFHFRIADYYVKNGIIKKNPPRWKKDRRKIVLEPSVILYYTFNINKVGEFDGLYDVLVNVLGSKKMDYLIEERLSEREVQDIKQNRRLLEKIHTEIVKQKKSVKEIDNGYCRYYRTWDEKDILDLIFTAVRTEEKLMKHSDPKYKKANAILHAEFKKAKANVHKRAKLSHDKIYEEALEREKEKKAKERELDIINRDRLGFDSDSFKGEFYHGQKRKKNKS